MVPSDRLRHHALALLATVAFSTAALAQDCNTVRLATQAEVDAFTCTEVSVLTITGSVTDLSPLSSLTRVSDKLWIVGTGALHSLQGLSSVESLIGFDALNISHNSALTSLDGLNGLEDAYQLIIRDNDALTSIDALSGARVVATITIEENDALTTLDGLGAVARVATGRGGGLFVRDNDSLTSLDGLSSLSYIGGRLSIENNDALTSIGLDRLWRVTEPITISGNDALTDLDGLGGPSSLGHVYIRDNDALTTLKGLHNLTSVRELFISGNDALKSFKGLDKFTSVEWDLTIEDNDALTALDGLESVTYVGAHLAVRDNDALTSCSCGLAGVMWNGSYPGVGAGVTITDNAPEGQCSTLEVVLATPCESTPVEGAPTQDVSLSVHPNPTDQPARVMYELARFGTAQVAVYDALGRQVAVIASGPHGAGAHEVTLDTSTLQAGVYVVVVEAPGGVWTSRLTVAR